jgi:ABC-type nitrate/sulfonate/bicarbonate transport system ATPase subunit
MFQEATLMPHLTVKQNIELPLKITGFYNQQKVDNLIKVIGLEEYSNYLPKKLSGGMKTRVALARAFVTEPELLLLDEPFSALDIAWKSKLYVELEKLKKEINTTVIVVTHDVQEALLLADQVVVMNNHGSIETQKEVKSDYSTMNRVKNISKYMNSIYETYMLPIQDAIINGQNRKK